MRTVVPGEESFLERIILFQLLRGDPKVCLEIYAFEFFAATDSTPTLSGGRLLPHSLGLGGKTIFDKIATVTGVGRVHDPGELNRVIVNGPLGLKESCQLCRCVTRTHWTGFVKGASINRNRPSHLCLR